MVHYVYNPELKASGEYHTNGKELFGSVNEKRRGGGPVQGNGLSDYYSKGSIDKSMSFDLSPVLLRGRIHEMTK